MHCRPSFPPGRCALSLSVKLSQWDWSEVISPRRAVGSQGDLPSHFPGRRPPLFLPSRRPPMAASHFSLFSLPPSSLDARVFCPPWSTSSLRQVNFIPFCFPKSVTSPHFTFLLHSLDFQWLLSPESSCPGPPTQPRSLFGLRRGRPRTLKQTPRPLPHFFFFLPRFHSGRSHPHSLEQRPSFMF